MKVELIKADVSDCERMLEIQKICFAPHLERYKDYETSPALSTLDKIKRRVENENCYKIYYNNKWVGSLNIQALGDRKYKLHIINILPEYQNRRIGQRAIKLAEELFPDATYWCLETLTDMPENRHTYEKCGYKLTGESEKINDNLTIIFYEKTILRNGV